MNYGGYGCGYQTGGYGHTNYGYGNSGYGGSGYGGSSGYALILVLFILLVIIGASSFTF